MTGGEQQSSERHFLAQLLNVHRDADQLFFWLLIAQWVFAVGLSVVVSPYAWEGRERSVHIHVQLAVFFGALLNVLPLVLIRNKPGAAVTRHVVAGVQMLWSALLIDLTGGRIETHFHVFGSLAFVAFYRDIGVLLTATLVVALDHVARGLFWPEAVYGTDNPEWWRSLEHVSWVAFEVVVLLLGTVRARREMMELAKREAALEENTATVEQQVEVRTRELAESVTRYRALIERSNVIPWELDPRTGQVVYIAPQATHFFGCSMEQLTAGRFGELVHPDDRQHLQDHLSAAFAGRSVDGDSVDYRVIAGGRLMHVRTTLGALSPGEPLRGITMDISKQTKLEGELRQAQKLESVGKLAAGVAHEINTPVQFVSDSVHFVKTACTDLLALIERYRGTGSRDAEQHAAEIDLPYLKDQVPRALEMALDGLGRVTDIVRSMKEFAYPHTAEMVSVDMNRAIQSTLTIASGEYKYVAELETQFGDLPKVCCHVGDINQVVLNIVVNAAHAIADKKAAEKGKISVRTVHDGEHVTISIEDSGGGIPEHLHERIYDPFFTTKAVGSGTGQGLAIARTIIAERHQGELWFETRAGVGTTFFIRLPIAGQQWVEQPAA